MGLNDRFQRVQNAWNAFMNKDPTLSGQRSYGTSYAYRPDKIPSARRNDKSIITSVITHIAIDAAAIKIEHVRLDSDDRYIETISSCLNDCLTLEANIDQTGRALVQDCIMSMLDEGCIALVPTVTDIDPNETESYKIMEMRVGKIIEWRPAFVKVRLYNDRTGHQEEIMISKSIVSIIENPMYEIMNKPNSTMQRLIRKLNLLDVIDEQSGSGKLDLLIQLPYIIKSEGRRQEAETRRKNIEEQLKGPYGIAYTDGTERVTQLNRPVENNLMKQIEYLTSMLYSQLGLTAEIMSGTADDKTMNNYYTRTIEPILSAIVDEMKRKFLTKTARSQKQSIRFFRDPFKLVPVTSLPDIADTFTRNEIMTSNEFRQVIGMKPSKDPNADQLRNKNINQAGAAIANGGSTNTNQPVSTTGETQPPQSMTEEEYQDNMADLDELDEQLDEMTYELDDGLKHYASDYYDPEKAREYYERTKELKGRQSKSGLNDAGKAAADYVKTQLTTEKKQKIDLEKTSIQSQADIHKEQMQNKIDSLRAQLKNMSKEQKAQVREKFMLEIDSMREENKAFRTQLKEAFKKTKSDLNTEYDDKYLAELDKIRNTAGFKAAKKAKKEKKRGRSLDDYRI